MPTAAAKNDDDHACPCQPHGRASFLEEVMRLTKKEKALLDEIGAERKRLADKIEHLDKFLATQKYNTTGYCTVLRKELEIVREYDKVLAEKAALFEEK